MNKKDYYINKLDNILQDSGIPSSYYSFNGYMEEAICLDQLTHSYLVYIGERGNKFDQKEHIDIIDACHDIISRLSNCKSQENELFNKFLEE